jgi:hypothetical protein
MGQPQLHKRLDVRVRNAGCEPGSAIEALELLRWVQVGEGELAHEPSLGSLTGRKPLSQDPLKFAAPGLGRRGEASDPVAVSPFCPVISVGFGTLHGIDQQIDGSTDRSRSSPVFQLTKGPP